MICIPFMQALIWSKMSTGLPIEISSAMKGQNFISFCRLDIDIHRYDRSFRKSWVFACITHCEADKVLF